MKEPRPKPGPLDVPVRAATASPASRRGGRGTASRSRPRSCSGPPLSGPSRPRSFRTPSRPRSARGRPRASPGHDRPDVVLAELHLLRHDLLLPPAGRSGCVTLSHAKEPKRRGSARPAGTEWTVALVGVDARGVPLGEDASRPGVQPRRDGLDRRQRTRPSRDRHDALASARDDVGDRVRHPLDRHRDEPGRVLVREAWGPHEAGADCSEPDVPHAHVA
jgi:hypothetical protein